MSRTRRFLVFGVIDISLFNGPWVYCNAAHLQPRSRSPSEREGFKGGIDFATLALRELREFYSRTTDEGESVTRKKKSLVRNRSLPYRRLLYYNFLRTIAKTDQLLRTILLLCAADVDFVRERIWKNYG